MTSTERKWFERVREWRASGQTAAAFATGKAFQPSTLRYWASTLRDLVPEAPSAVSVRLAEVVRTPTRAVSGLVVVVGAAKIPIVRGFDGELLRAAVEALGGTQ